ncbi:SDR family NAD(P)-dependent oxidoreductase [Blastomonas sp.]|uniref:SDR family NAD(P)-dependent oxidoreductase n=1 Tax=Blastomonas sp. TaxID=1909299 RepID=UPI00262BEE15|nr:SDR family NAD(P)-dependent oxidoreductase [Blastomonas sp.]MDM7955644.1 SDR family NAD(P)-dependent oxidoreductase [Blastomonas sp.]
MTPCTVIIGASGGIGAAMVRRSNARGENVIALARSLTGDGYLDLEDEASIAAGAERVRAQGLEPTCLIVATGLLHIDGKGPEKSLKDIDPAWMARNFAVNTIGPALVAKHFIPLMPRKAPARFAAIGARVGSISDNRLGGWYGYRAAKAALHMTIRNISIEWSRRNDQSICVALHPGTVDTGLSKPFQGNVAEGRLFDADHSAACLLDVLDGLNPSDSGGIFAWDGTAIRP